MLIVGLNCYHGDVAAAVLRDGVLIAALEEERVQGPGRQGELIEEGRDVERDE